jgi:hypothetical protein
MSPDRLTLTRAEAIRRRKEEDQKRRDKLTQKRTGTPKPAATPKPVATPKPASRRKSDYAHLRLNTRSEARSVPAVTPRLRRRYDLAMSTPYGKSSSRHSQAPSISLPKIEFGPRWFSALLLIGCIFSIYFFLTEPMFFATEATILGNARVSAQDINSILGIANQPAALLNPAQIEYNIRAAFPEITGAYVQVDLPATVTITVAERQPVAAWKQDGQLVWVDAQGYAFPPRGLVEGLVTVSAAGAPPAPANVDVTQTIGARPFLKSELAAAIIKLSPHVPQGASLVYDPRYGLGWADPRGWQAYFGQSNGDMTVKFQVYQSMVDYLTGHGIHPTLISVEYPNSPFYRVSE